jgi:hypothetical protein
MYIQEHSNSSKTSVVYFNFIVVNDEVLRLMNSSVFHNFSIYKCWRQPVSGTFNALLQCIYRLYMPTFVLVVVMLLHSNTFWDNNTNKTNSGIVGYAEDQAV